MQLTFRRNEINLALCAVRDVVNAMACDLTQGEKKNGDGRQLRITQAVANGARKITVRDIAEGSALEVVAGKERVVYSQHEYHGARGI